MTVVAAAAAAAAQGRRPSSTTPPRRLTKEEKFLFFAALPQILFTPGADLKDSRVADVPEILPLIIVAQCYLLLKMV